MKICIHRGTNEIGGSCVELATENTRILIDIGMPLANKDGSDFKMVTGTAVDDLVAGGVLPQVEGLYSIAPRMIDAILISHAHMDHFGLINYSHDTVPKYMSKATEALININTIFTKAACNLVNVSHFEKSVSFKIGDFTITPYWADHSAFDAYSFLIQAEGKSVFYSGDFRGHGRKSKVFQWFTHNAPENIDVLLMEGTTMGRPQVLFKTESEIERQLTDLFNQSKIPVVMYTSGQNIDRLVSVYRACMASKRDMLVDLYIAYVLRQMAKYSKIPYPSKNYPLLKVFYASPVKDNLANSGHKDILFRFRSYKITRGELDSQLQNAVMLVRPTMKKYLSYLPNLNDGVFVYSMWEGYTKKKDTKSFLKFFEQRNFSIQTIHTSGHADIPTLQRMVDTLKPKHIIPIHTTSRDAYKDIFSAPILKLEDGEVHMV